MSRWFYGRFKCHNMEEDHNCVLCDIGCVGEDGCSPSRDYRNVPVTVQIKFASRVNGTRYIPIPLACRCTPRHGSTVAARICENATE